MHAYINRIFIFFLLVSLALFIAVCSTGAMANSNSTSGAVMGFWDATSAAIIIIGFPLVISLYAIALSLHHKNMGTSKRR